MYLIMKKLIFLISLLISTSAFANCKRPYWDSCAKIVNNKCISTNEYILYRDGADVKINNKNKVKSGIWTSYYTDKLLLKRADVNIDHVLPFKFMKDNGGCDNIKEIYNDEENLVISSQKENRDKWHHLTVPFETNAPYKKKQCYICNKWKLNNCDLVCQDIQK